MYHRIIFADDGSPLARAAVPRAAAIARASEGEVLVVRASRAAGVDRDDLDYYQWDACFYPEARAHAESSPQEAEPHLSDVVHDLEARGVPRAASLVVRGEAGDALQAVADDFEADLLVMSSHGESGLRRAVLGSVAEHLVREARETPILLCPPPAEESSAEPGIERVLLTLDGSALADQAVPHAEHLARSLGVPLILFRATESEADLMHATMPGGMPASTAWQIAGDQREAATLELAALADALTDRGVADVTVEVAVGDPTAAILDAVVRLDIGVIVMATRGRGGIGRLLLGSVADTVARGSESAAVLLVRPDDD